MSSKGKDFSKEKTITQQHMTDAVNINKLVAKHGIANIQVIDRPQQYLDVSNVKSFHEMQSHVVMVEQNFMKLPANIRGRFKNKANNMAEFMSDAKNYPEAWKMGLMDDPDGLLEDAWNMLHKPKEPEKTEESTPVVEPEQTTLDDKANVEK